MAFNLIPAYFILIIVLLLSFGIQVYFARRVKKGEDYALAGKGLGLLPTFGILASAGAFGGMTLGSAELAYTVGISAGWYACTAGIVLVIQGQFLATRFREALVKYDVWTMPELFEKWFGATLREVYAWIYIPVTIVFLGGAVAGSSAPIISLLTGLSVTASKVVAIIIFASLILAGGYLGAAWQAFFILFFVYIGAMVAAFIAIFLAGGWGNLSNLLPLFPYFSLAGMGGIRLTALVLATGSGLLYDQFYWQMAAAANSDKTAKRGITLGGLIFAPIGFICAIIGLAIAGYKPGLTDPIN